jgi:hypothetical protein
LAHLELLFQIAVFRQLLGHWVHQSSPLIHPQAHGQNHQLLNQSKLRLLAVEVLEALVQEQLNQPVHFMVMEAQEVAAVLLLEVILPLLYLDHNLLQLEDQMQIQHLALLLLLL